MFCPDMILLGVCNMLYVPSFPTRVFLILLLPFSAQREIWDRYVKRHPKSKSEDFLPIYKLKPLLFFIHSCSWASAQETCMHATSLSLSHPARTSTHTHLYLSCIFLVHRARLVTRHSIPTLPSTASTAPQAHGGSRNSCPTAMDIAIACSAGRL
jgi:hypothetical protein